MAGTYIIVRCMGHKSLKIYPGDTLRIGRHNTNDLVLNDGTVSRFHCSLEWDKDEDRPWLVDNNSANGVDVDGKDVDGKHYLIGDNQIGVGDFTVVLQLKGAKSMTKRMARMNKRATEALIEDEGETVLRLFSDSKRRLRGTFTENAALQKVLVDLEGDKRTGTLVVKDGARQTKVIFGQGRLITVKVKGQDIGARDALLNLLEVDGGSYTFTADIELSEENLDLSVREFLENEGDQTMRFSKSPLDD